MDVQMPEMDGLEATRSILKPPSSESRPWIIAMTAYAMQGDREECLSAGMNDYISKPIRIEAIVQALDKYRQLQMPTGFVHKAEPISTPEIISHSILTKSPQTPEVPSGVTVTPAIDATVMQDLRDMAGEDAVSFLSDIIDSYLEDAPIRIQAIKEALACADAVALHKSAHAFKSLGATVGAITVAQVCAALEAIGQAGTIAGASKLMQQLQVEYDRAIAALHLDHSALSAQRSALYLPQDLQ
jgi:HPt (histidine-containing phosphotransfer) domain-containing protein